MSVVTLTTDFGSGDYAIGQMKGVILGLAPEAKIVDLTHEIPRHNILAAQFELENAVPYFPAGTIHVVVVDPGVGTHRRAIAARLGEWFFVGPDNGLVTPLLEQAETYHQTVEMIHTNNPHYWRSKVSSIFHGRDIFAPIAGHLARGVLLNALGERINDPVRASIPAAEMQAEGWRGQVIQVDHFGNLAVNIKRSHLEGMGSVQVTIGGVAIHGLVRTFGESEPGELVAMIDSSDHLSICVVNGSAAENLSAQVGTPVEVQLHKKD
jgi:S-adenosylmethionine hydrolase